MSQGSKLDAHAEDIFSDLGARVSQRSIAQKHGVARSTLQAWLRRRDLRALNHAEAEGLSEEPSDGFTEIPVFYRDYSEQDHHYIYPLGDVHKGSPAHAEDRWHEWLGYLENEPNASLLGTGDFLNAALKDSKSEAYDEVSRVGVAKRTLRKELQPLSDRIDLLMPGNHEDRIYRAVGDCPVEDIADTLETPYAREAAVVIVKVGDIEYEISVRHGTGGGQVGARANRLSVQARTIIADIYISGHTHSQLVFPQDVFVIAQQRVVRKRQLFVSSGSFLNYEGYAAKAGYPPQKVGAPRIRLDGTRKDAHASI